jgi:hypothetical protein
MTKFPVFDVQNEIDIIEYLGTKEKFWLNFDGKLQLLKFGREGTGENWAEKVACEICALLDLPHAHYEFATYQGKLGVLSPKMNPDGSRLILGNELIDSVEKKLDGTRFYKYRGHTVSRVIAALQRSTDDPDEALRCFVGYLMLDAWIGNGDRHNENWGLVLDAQKRTITLAPTFDHASSLGRELSDAVRAERMVTKDKRFDVRAYAEKTRSGLYMDRTDKRPLSTIDAFLLAGLAGKRHEEFWLSRLSKVDPNDLTNIFDRIPAEFISSEAASFALKMLEINRQKLLGQT